MKRLLTLALAAVPLIAYSDAQVNVLDDYCHIPYSNANTDNEKQLGGCGGDTTQLPNGNVNGFGFVIKPIVQRASLPPNARPTSEDARGIERIVTSGAESGAACTVTDTGGTQYQTNNWRAVTTGKRIERFNQLAAIYEIQCIQAAPVPAE